MPLSVLPAVAIRRAFCRRVLYYDSERGSALDNDRLVAYGELRALQVRKD